MKGLGLGGFFVRERESAEREVRDSGEEREKTKYTSYSARVNLHGYCNSLKNLEDFTHF